MTDNSIYKNRSRYDLIYDILKEASMLTGARKTALMYAARLSQVQSERLRCYLLDTGLLVVDKNKFYTLTEKGRKVKEILEELRELVKEK